MKATAILSAILFWLAGVSAVRASGTLSELKTAGQEMFGHAFTITSQPLPSGGAQFHVVISDQGGTFDPHFDHASLGIVTIIRDASRESRSVGDTRRLTLEKQDHSLVCDFTVEKTDLANPDFCFIFTLNDRHQRPSVDFVFARLQKLLTTPPK
ncbi:MAG: hypothetical protein WDN28_12055 [Chthoniobacter sp.]